MTHLVTSFSRDADAEAADAEAAAAEAAAATKVGPKYVQHKILEKREEVGKLLTNPTAMIYICGDAK